MGLLARVHVTTASAKVEIAVGAANAITIC